MNLLWGLIGVVIGLTSAAAGLTVERRRRARQGLPTDIAGLFGAERDAWRPDSVERRLLTEAAALAFAVAAVGLLVYAATSAIFELPDPPAYALASGAGGLLGVSCVLVSRHRRWA